MFYFEESVEWLMRCSARCPSLRRKLDRNTNTHRSLRSGRRPPYSYGGEAGLPWRSIQEHVCRFGGGGYTPTGPPPVTTGPTAGPGPTPTNEALPNGSATAAASRLVLPTTLGGGPKPCRGAVELIMEAPADGGARTVMLIWRDDFRICTHLYILGEKKKKKQTVAIEERKFSKQDSSGGRQLESLESF